jgi:hypothetical protein
MYMKDYQNITLSLPKEILIKVKHIAIDKHTSVTGLLVKVLEEMVQKENDYDKAKRHHLEFLNDVMSLNTKGEISWKRDDIHER